MKIDVLFSTISVRVCKNMQILPKTCSSGKSAGIVINMVSLQNLLAQFCCVLGKDTLRLFPLLGGLGKQFKITVISLLNFKRIAIFWHLRKQVGVIAYPMY